MKGGFAWSLKIGILDLFGIWNLIWDDILKKVWTLK